MLDNLLLLDHPHVPLQIEVLRIDCLNGAGRRIDVDADRVVQVICFFLVIGHGG